jgi:hypothetical protein
VIDGDCAENNGRFKIAQRQRMRCLIDNHWWLLPHHRHINAFAGAEAPLPANSPQLYRGPPLTAWAAWQSRVTIHVACNLQLSDLQRFCSSLHNHSSRISFSFLLTIFLLFITTFTLSLTIPHRQSLALHISHQPVAQHGSSIRHLLQDCRLPLGGVH